MALRDLLTRCDREGRRAIIAVNFRSFRLEVDDRPVPVEGAMWSQIAAEGEFRGHPSGPFTFSADVFADLVKNFRAHPSYELDEATKLGRADVIAWDFHHASEEPAALVGVEGAPAQGWVLELEIRKGDEGLELWALTRWLEPARTFVQQGKYKWASVAVWPEATDPVSGARVGWYMSSVALTNDPFIQGMAPLAAHRKGGAITLGTDFLLGEIKFFLGMPETATLAEVQAELAKLRAFAKPGAVPPVGVDVERLVKDLKFLLNLPVLTDADLVFAEVDKLMGAIAATPPAPLPTIPDAPSDSLSPTTTAATTAAQGRYMKDQLIKLARAVGIEVSAAELEDEVRRQVLAARVVDKILAEMSEAEQAKKAIAAMLTALQVEDADGALTRLTDMMTASAELEKAMPALAALKEGAIEAQDEEEEEDVDQVINARGWPAEIKPALMLQRSGNVTLTKEMPWDEFAKAIETKRAAKKAWDEKYPAPAGPADPGYLEQSLTTERTTQHASPVLRALTGGAMGVKVGGAKAAPAMPDQPGGGGLHLQVDKLPGANLVAKCEYYIREQAREAGRELCYDDVNTQAVMLSRELRPKLVASGR